jgi:hypothetical protein
LAIFRVYVYLPEGIPPCQACQQLGLSCSDESLRVAQLGGLQVLGTERHESQRIDRQLRGRAGRQGRRHKGTRGAGNFPGKMVIYPLKMVIFPLKMAIYS